MLEHGGRLRQAARRGAQVSRLTGLADDWLMPLASTLQALPSAWESTLASVATAVADSRGVAAPVPGAAATEAARAVAQSLLTGERKAILLGNGAAAHPRASALLQLANWIGEQVGARVGFFGEAGNSVGAQLVAAMPGPGGLTAAQMLSRPNFSPMNCCNSNSRTGSKVA